MPVTTYDPNQLINQYYTAAQTAYAANLKRQQQAESIYDKIIAMYGEGGTYGAGYLKQLAGEKVQDVGKVSQAAIGKGLYGLRDYGAEWEATVGEPGRLKLEDIKMERLSSALTSKAGFLSSISEPYPDYGTLQQALTAAGSIPRGGIAGTTTTGGGAGTSLWGRDVLSMPTGGTYAGAPTTPESYYGPTQKATAARVAAGGETPEITMAQGYGPAFQAPETTPSPAISGAAVMGTPGLIPPAYGGALIPQGPIKGTTAGAATAVPKYLTDAYGKEVTGQSAAFATFLVNTGKMPATTNVASWAPGHISQFVAAQKAFKTQSSYGGFQTLGG